MVSSKEISFIREAVPAIIKFLDLVKLLELTTFNAHTKNETYALRRRLMTKLLRKLV